LKSGYNADDVRDYLQYLKIEGIIKSWKYNRLTDFHWNKLLIPSKTQWRSKTVVIHGFTLPSDEKKAMNTRIRKWRVQRRTLERRALNGHDNRSLIILQHCDGTIGSHSKISKQRLVPDCIG
jgi:hypothetical protein